MEWPFREGAKRYSTDEQPSRRSQNWGTGNTDHKSTRTLSIASDYLSGHPSRTHMPPFCLNYYHGENGDKLNRAR
eukprot:15883339-Heterocapsa_arctica.AAC.1